MLHTQHIGFRPWEQDWGYVSVVSSTLEGELGEGS